MIIIIPDLNSVAEFSLKIKDNRKERLISKLTNRKKMIRRIDIAKEIPT